MYAFGTQFFKNMVFDNAAWDYHTFDADRDTKAADDKQSRNLNATDPDLEPLPRTRRQADPLSRMERRRHRAAEHHRLLRQRDGEDGRAADRQLRAPLHGARNAALRRRLGRQQLRPVRGRLPAMPITTWMPRWSAGWKKASHPSASWPPSARATWTPRAPSCARTLCARIRWWRTTRAAAAPTTPPTSCAPSMMSRTVRARTLPPAMGRERSHCVFLVAVSWWSVSPGRPAAGGARHRARPRISPPRAPWSACGHLRACRIPVGTAAHDAVRDYIVQQLVRAGRAAGGANRHRGQPALGFALQCRHRLQRPGAPARHGSTPKR